MDKEEIYDNFFDIKKESGRVFTVEIVGAKKDSYWYENQIGKRFDVVDEGGKNLIVVSKCGGGRYIEEGKYILKEDAIILGI